MIGANMHGPAFYQGTIYAWQRTGTLWTQAQMIQAMGGVGNDDFGFSVSISDDGVSACAGAVQRAMFVGAVYCYKRSGSTWSQYGGIYTASDGQQQDVFGYSVAVSNYTTLAIGAPYWPSGNGDGAVYTFG